MHTKWLILLGIIIASIWTALALAFGPTRSHPMGGDPSMPFAVRSGGRETCFHAILLVSDELRYYAKTRGGKLPLDGWDAKNHRPKWASTVINMQSSEEMKNHYLLLMKCPEDKSGESVSYECPLAGKNINKIPKDQWAHTVFLREKDFRFNHHYVVYLDRNIE